jgi:micrococcal nuclease
VLWWRLGHRHTHRTTLSRTHRTLFLLTAVVGLLACGGNTAPSGDGVVVSVADGDTVEVRLNGRTENVRLIGVDTPETVHPTKPVGCYGPQASAFTKQLLPPGTKVRLVRDAEARDYYNRLLAYVYRSSDNSFVNLELVRLGYGVPLNIEPNSAHRQEFVDAAFTAQQAQLGLWGACHG